MAKALVDPAWITSHPDARVVDVRWYLPATGKRGRDEYAAGHIPGARFLDIDGQLSGDPAGGPGRHPLPDPARFEAAMADAGIGADSDVVAYDDSGGSTAARLWFLLRLYGHRAGAYVLDGGLAAWRAGGGALETAEPAARAPAHRFRADSSRLAEWIVDRAAVDAARRDPRTVILDARVSERYRGDHEPVDARPGHIPGARSAPWIENLNKTGRFRPVDQLRAHFTRLGAAGAERVIAYCGSGVTACHDLLAMHEAGCTNTLLYEGSWSDWARDPTLPAATGND